MNVNYYQDDFKQKVISHYLGTDESIATTAKKFNVAVLSLRNWIKKFKNETPEIVITKNSKYRNFYPDEFKREVAQHYLNTGDSFAKTAKRFNLTSTISVRSWVTKFRGEIIVADMNKTIATNTPAIPESPSLMAQRIKELEYALVNEQLKNASINTMIDIAERDLNISIRKKSGARQSRK